MYFLHKMGDFPLPLLVYPPRVRTFSETFQKSLSECAFPGAVRPTTTSRIWLPWIPSSAPAKGASLLEPHPTNPWRIEIFQKEIWLPLGGYPSSCSPNIRLADKTIIESIYRWYMLVYISGTLLRVPTFSFKILKDQQKILQIWSWSILLVKFLPTSHNQKAPKKR